MRLRVSRHFFFFVRMECKKEYIEKSKLMNPPFQRCPFGWGGAHDARLRYETELFERLLALFLSPRIECSDILLHFLTSSDFYLLYFRD